MKAPEIFNFLSVQHYLQKLYEYRKSTEKKFSYQFWAEEVGITDRSYLRQIVTGQRGLNNELAHQMAKQLGLTDLEYQYFVLLTEYSAADEVSRNAIGIKLIELIKKRQQS